MRELQRCRREGDWEDHVTKFEARIRSFTDASTAAAIMLYFERNWFVDLWRGAQLAFLGWVTH